MKPQATTVNHETGTEEVVELTQEEIAAYEAVTANADPLSNPE
jgi:hypothetical protein